MSLALGYCRSPIWSRHRPDIMTVHIAENQNLGGIDESDGEPSGNWSRDQIVNLNVGGECFSTRIGTLTDTGGTYFSNAFSGKFLIEETHFIDRDPRLFRIVLHYLRTRSVMVPEGPEYLYLYRSLLEEARYFGIDSMADFISKMITKYEECFQKVKPDKIGFEDFGDDFSPVPIISRERIIPTDPIRFDDFDF